MSQSQTPAFRDNRPRGPSLAADPRPRVVFDPAAPPPLSEGGPPWQAGAYELGEVACPVTGLRFYAAKLFIPRGEGVPRYEPEDWPPGRSNHPVAALDQFVGGRVATCDPAELGIDPAELECRVAVHPKTFDLLRGALGSAGGVDSIGSFVRRVLAGDFGDEGRADALEAPTDWAFPFWPVLARPARSKLVHESRVEWFAYGRFALSMAAENAAPRFHATNPEIDAAAAAQAALSSYNPLGVVLYRMPSVPAARWPQGVRCVVSPEPFLTAAGVL